MSEAKLAANLLVAARDLLRGEIVPSLPGRLRFPAAMIANAMAIASRELEHGPDNRVELQTLFARLYPEAPATASLDEFERRLVRELRAGRFDRNEDRNLRALLHGRTRLRLKVSAPAPSGRGTTP